MIIGEKAADFIGGIPMSEDAALKRLIVGDDDKMETIDNNDRNRVKSIDKALDVLLLFSREENELAHAEIARRMGWTTSTASRIIGTLLERDFLSKNEDNGKYRLGNMVYYLGAIARGNSDMRSCALPVMQKINQITNETVHIFVRDGISRVCIEQVTSHQTIRMSCEIGVRDVLWIGNTGRVLMAFCEKQKREELFRRIHEAAPEVDMKLLREKVMRVREKGFAGRDGEWDRHCACIAAPIFDQNGMLQGCLGISVPDFRLPEDDSDYVRLILEGAKEISLHMGWYQ